jgi:Ca2+-binding RTX toxin-like protein
MTTYTGTSGNDVHEAASGEDTFNLLAGDDTLMVWRSFGSYVIDAGDGNDYVQVAGSVTPSGHTALVYSEGTGSYPRLSDGAGFLGEQVDAVNVT